MLLPAQLLVFLIRISHLPNRLCRRNPFPLKIHVSEAEAKCFAVKMRASMQGNSVLQTANEVRLETSPACDLHSPEGKQREDQSSPFVTFSSSAEKACMRGGTGIRVNNDLNLDKMDRAELRTARLAHFAAQNLSKTDNLSPT